MLVHLTRLLLLLQGLIILGIALAAHYVREMNWTMSLLLGTLAVLLVRMGITANNFFINRYYRGPPDEDTRLSWLQWLRVYLNEFMATMHCSSWAMPFLAFAGRPIPHPVGLPVLLIHGYACNSGYWHRMSKALAAAHITHYAIDLEPLFAGIDDYAPLIREAVNRLCMESGKDRVIIVAHSMGGLVARAYLRKEGDTRIAKVITLGSPHKGSGLANFGLGANSQQMRWTGSAREGQASAWLCQLQASENEQGMARFVSIYSLHDNIIAPQSSSILPGAKNIAFRGIGHVALAYTPEIHECVIREILATPAETAPPQSHMASRLS